MINDKTFTPDQIIEKIKDDMEELDNFFIRYHLKKLGFRHIRTVTIERVKACYFLNKYGFWITSPILMAIVGKGYMSNLQALHNLGDKNIIQLHGYDGSKLSWKFNQEFSDMIEGSK